MYIYNTRYNITVITHMPTITTVILSTVVFGIQLFMINKMDGGEAAVVT